MKNTIEVSEELATCLDGFETTDQKGIKIERKIHSIKNPFTKDIEEYTVCEISAIGSFTPEDYMAIGRIQERTGC